MIQTVSNAAVHNALGSGIKYSAIFAGFMNRTLLVVLFLFAVVSKLGAQVTSPVNGVHDDREGLFAFVNATIYASPEETIDNGTLIIKEGKVEAIGAGLAPPKGAVIVDCQGKSIYPSFIDLTPVLRLKEKAPKKEAAKKKSTHVAAHWNSSIHPEYEHLQEFPLADKVQKDWLASGFGVLNLHKADGIMRGSSQLVYPGFSDANKAVIVSRAAQHFAFSKGSSKEPYPSSFMGAVALLRQTFYDAQWYANGGIEEERNTSLQAVNDLAGLPSIFSVKNPLSVRNVNDLTSEFNRSFIIRGTGSEYRLKLETPQKLIEPLALSKPFDVSDPFTSQYVSLEDALEWRNAPCNIRLLLDAGHEVAITRDSLKTSRKFIQNLQRVMACGLSHAEALKALTVTPAQFLGIDQQLGALRPGFMASFFISTDRIDHKDFKVWQHWNAGELVFESQAQRTDIEGKYSLIIDSAAYELHVSDDKSGKFKAKLALANATGDAFKVNLEQQRELITMVITKKDSVDNSAWRLTGKISLKGGVWDGRGQDETGRWFAWSAIRSTEELPGKPKQTMDSIAPIEPFYPMGAYGRDSINEDNTFVIVSATVWTATDTGILEKSNIYVENGIIQRVGNDFEIPQGVKRYNAKGRHVTPGIIDEHSHIGIRGGVNEGTQASSAEVRIGDAVNPWDINLFRQLAGGVTTAQLLHGSANPIGGQSAIIKFRWGKGAGDMIFQEAPGFIKFALGENVKRSNSPKPGDRFPLTRMGVEQVYADAFTRAREYELRAASIPSGKRSRKNAEAPTNRRRDLELDALVEILNEERFITCHSYVQSEINMLMNVADTMGFKVNTFTHILEGYKVSDRLREHGAHASTFSDWWAYKFEVNDAIPYNAALLTKAGVNTGINSDDAEMGRRLNQEAAKAMKYGGLSKEEAIKLVTINPAKMLHVEEWVGSIEVGKQADLVIWSGDPLSVYSEADQTFVDGILYFDRNWLPEMEARDEALRSELLAEMLKQKDSKSRKPGPKGDLLYHCDTEIHDYTVE